MPDTFAVTIIAIAAVTLIGMFVRGRMRDRCLRHFEHNTVTLELKDGKLIKGSLYVKSTGIEIVYDSIREDSGYPEGSYILYKPEFVNIQSIFRSPDDLKMESAEKREKIMEQIRIPGSTRRLGRRLRNFANTVRDSVTEIFNLFMGKVRTMPTGGMVTSQQKYISQAQAQLGGAAQTAFEPLLENHIGQNVVVEIKRGDAVERFGGLLREYTAGFVEIMDVNYNAGKKDKTPFKTDLVIPRHSATVRHVS